MAMLRDKVFPLFSPQCQNYAMTHVIVHMADSVTESSSGPFIMGGPQTSATRASPLGRWQKGPGQAILCPLSCFNSLSSLLSYHLCTPGLCLTLTVLTVLQLDSGYTCNK